MKKYIVICLLMLCVKIAFSQDTFFPPYSNYSELENLLSVKYKGLLSKNNFNILSKDDLQKMSDIVTNIESKLNWSGWASIYVGYNKRAEAKILFNAAEVFSEQKGFYQDKNQMETALGYINRGFDYINQYSPSLYPPYVEINVIYQHDANGKTTGTEGQKISVPIDENKAIALRSHINEYLGNTDKALDDYYASTHGKFSLSPYNDDKIETAYSVANRILELSSKTKKYDQRLVNFCIWALSNNKVNTEEAGQRSAGWKLRWSKLEPLIMQALDAAAAENSATKYVINLKDESFLNRSTDYDWIIPVINKFDSRHKLITFQESSRKTDPGNRTVYNLVNYCSRIVEGNASEEVTTAANAILQKHFAELAEVAVAWSSTGSDTGWEQVKFVSDRIDKYPVDEKQKKAIEKSMKKCKKYLNYDKYFKN